MGEAAERAELLSSLVGLKPMMTLLQRQFRLAAMRTLAIYRDDHASAVAEGLQSMWPAPLDSDWLLWFLTQFKVRRTTGRRLDELLGIVKYLRRRIATLKANDLDGLLDLFEQLTSTFPKNHRFKHFPSAASKLIWVLNPRAGIIYDSKAAAGLERALREHGFDAPYDPKVSIHNYEPFVIAWQDLWRDEQIQALLDDAVHVVRHADRSWKPRLGFRRRVFDQYLVALAHTDTYRDGPRDWSI
ncbi:MAG TPA: hypothetical protein VMU69_22790 [Bradyrhizobium sp.]|nr:hypothetical protein [Bradyrhizobium sp.]